MIVAPLMTPILGTVLSIATGDGRTSSGRCSSSPAQRTVVAIGYIVGRIVPYRRRRDELPGRGRDPSARLVDLVAALATGAVGAFALVRSDVSDTLPGVAIAISLVPPLAVVGTTLESGATHQSIGALLLFLTTSRRSSSAAWS